MKVVDREKLLPNVPPIVKMRGVLTQLNSSNEKFFQDKTLYSDNSIKTCDSILCISCQDVLSMLKLGDLGFYALSAKDFDACLCGHLSSGSSEYAVFEAFCCSLKGSFARPSSKTMISTGGEVTYCIGGGVDPCMPLPPVSLYSVIYNSIGSMWGPTLHRAFTTAKNINVFWIKGALSGLLRPSDLDFFAKDEYINQHNSFENFSSRYLPVIDRAFNFSLDYKKLSPPIEVTVPIFEAKKSPQTKGKSPHNEASLNIPLSSISILEVEATQGSKPSFKNEESNSPVSSHLMDQERVFKNVNFSDKNKSCGKYCGKKSNNVIINEVENEEVKAKNSKFCDQNVIGLFKNIKSEYNIKNIKEKTNNVNSDSKNVIDFENEEKKYENDVQNVWKNSKNGNTSDKNVIGWSKNVKSDVQNGNSSDLNVIGEVEKSSLISSANIYQYASVHASKPRFLGLLNKYGFTLSPNVLKLNRWGIPCSMGLMGGGESAPNGWGPTTSQPPAPGAWGGNNPANQQGSQPHWGLAPNRNPVGPPQGSQPQQLVNNLKQNQSNASNNQQPPHSSAAANPISAGANQQPSPAQQPQQQQQANNQQPVTSQQNSWAQTAGKGISTANGASSEAQKLQSIKEALLSCEGWGTENVNQETHWDLPASPEPSKDAATPLWKINSNNGCDVWENNLRNGGAAPPKPQQAPWGSNPMSNYGGTWGEEDENTSDASNAWGGNNTNANQQQWNNAPPQPPPQTNMWGNALPKKPDFGPPSTGWNDHPPQRPNVDVPNPEWGGGPLKQNAHPGPLPGPPPHPSLPAHPGVPPHPPGPHPANQPQMNHPVPPHGPVPPMGGPTHGPMPIGPQTHPQGPPGPGPFGPPGPPPQHAPVAPGPPGGWPAPNKDIKPTGWGADEQTQQQMMRKEMNDGTSLWGNPSDQGNVSKWREMPAQNMMGRPNMPPTNNPPGRLPVGMPNNGPMKPDQRMWSQQQGRNGAWGDAPSHDTGNSMWGNEPPKPGPWGDPPVTSPSWGSKPKTPTQAPGAWQTEQDSGDLWNSQSKEKRHAYIEFLIELGIKEKRHAYIQSLIELQLSIKQKEEEAMRHSNMGLDDPLMDIGSRPGGGATELWRNLDDHHTQSPFSGPGDLNTPNFGQQQQRFPPSQQMPINSPMQQQQQQQQSNNTNPNNIRMLMHHIQLAAQAGYLNPAILNQPLAPNSLMLLNNMLQQISLLQKLVQQHSMLQQAQPLRGDKTSAQHLLQVNIHITKTKQQIQNYQNQITTQQALYVKQQQQPNQNQAQQPPHMNTHMNPPPPPNLQSNSHTDFLKSGLPDNFYSAFNHMGVSDPIGGIGSGGNQLNQGTNHMNPVANQMNQHTNQPQGSRLNQWKLPSVDNDDSSILPGSDFIRAPGKPSLQSNSPNLTSLMPSSNAWSLNRTTEIGGWPESNHSHESSHNANTSERFGGLDSAWNSNQTASSSNSAAASAANIGLDIKPFEPGKPWMVKNIEDDPTITPGSVTRSPLSLGIKDSADILTTKSSNANSMGDIASGVLPSLSLSSNTWSFNPSSGQNTGSPLGSDNKPVGSSGIKTSTWSDGTSNALASELWGGSGAKLQLRGPPPGMGVSGGMQKPILGSNAGGTWSGLGGRSSWAGDQTKYSALHQQQSWMHQMPSTWLLLKNLTPQIDGSTLKTLCMQHGPLINFHLSLNYGFALVNYSTREEAAKAQGNLNNCLLSNTTIYAEFASDADVKQMLGQAPTSNYGGTVGGRGGTPTSQSLSKVDSWGAVSSTTSSLWGNGPTGGNSLWGGASLGGDSDQHRTTPSSLKPYLPDGLLTSSEST